MLGTMIMVIIMPIARLVLLTFASSASAIMLGKRRYLTTMKVASAMNMLLIMNRYSAPLMKCQLRVAIPKPTVHRGGIRAVAMATPESTVPFSLREFSSIPATPPKVAISTS